MQLGNDIVDLKIDAEIRLRFRARILHSAEQDYLTAPDTLIWRLWAAKEAAFKAYRQLHPGFLIPAHWQVDLTARQVHYKDMSWALEIQEDADAVWAVCTSAPAKVLTRRYQADRELPPADLSLKARELLAEICAAHYPGATVQKKQDGVPTLTWQGQSIPFSLSHHARQVCVSLVLIHG